MQYVQVLETTILSYHCNLPFDQLSSPTTRTMDGVGGSQLPKPQSQSAYYYPPLPVQASHSSSHVTHPSRWAANGQIAPTRTTIYQSHQQSRPHPLHPPPQSIYPHRHVLEDQRIVALQMRTPSLSTNALGTGPHPSSRMPVFTSHRKSRVDFDPPTRPPNTAQAYTPFDTMWIQGMDQFYSQIPSMPLVLNTHDVHYQDWSTFMDSLALVWKEKFPLPEFVKTRPQSRISNTAYLIDHWNNSFFLPRRVSVVLYYGRERRSGRRAGESNDQLPLPESESADERERKYSLYLAYDRPYGDNPTQKPYSTSYHTIATSFASYRFYS